MTIRIEVERDLANREIALYVFDEVGNQTKVWLPWDIAVQTVGESEAAKPTLRLPYKIANDFLNALAQALDKADVKTTHQSFIEGELKAQTLHLEDMRHLVFPPVQISGVSKT